MTEKEIVEKIYAIFSSVMGVPAEGLSPESSPDNIEEWTSLKSMNLVVALEQEFNIQLSDEQIMEMMNMELIIEIISGAVNA